jgi:predicted RNA-binding Zn-ribbon protein involved in translation (DUF1610 family)
VVRRHGSDYLSRFGKALLPSRARALRDIARCRSPALGGHIAECQSCGSRHVEYRSCNNRACPQCGSARTDRWIEEQRDLLLPVPYFHVVFTLPEELRFLVRSHQRQLLPVLFRSAFEALSTLCRDPKHLGGRIGALAVLHTWTRALEWHPHVHMLVPGGALTDDGRWITAPKRNKRILVPTQKLARLFWGRFMWQARRAAPGVDFPDVSSAKRWIVYCKETVQGSDCVLEYLGRYVHRTAISNRAIVSCSEGSVSFRYRSHRDDKTKVMTLPPDEFLRRFLQHVLPRGFHRVRSFGFLHPKHRTTFRRLQLMLGRGRPFSSASRTNQGTFRQRCPACGGTALRRGPSVSCVELGNPTVRRNASENGPRAPPLVKGPA